MPERIENAVSIALQAQVIDRKVNAMRSQPRRLAPESRQFRRGPIFFIGVHAGLAGLAFFTLVQFEHEILCRVVQFHQLDVRLQVKPRRAVERGDLRKRQRRPFSRIEGHDEGPFDFCDVNRERMATAGKLRMRLEPRGQMRAEIAQGEMSGWDFR